MTQQLHSLMDGVVDPPIAEVHSWIEDRSRTNAVVLDVSQGAPDYPPADELRRHLADLVMSNDISRYSPVQGIPALREAVADRLSREYEGTIGAADVLITAGSNQGFCLAVSAIAGVGDEIVLPTPYYFNHDMWSRSRGIEPVYLETRASEGFLPDVERAEALLTDRTKAIVLVTPNNPTGVEYPPALIDAFGDLAQRRGVTLILDETYKDFRSDPARPHSLFAESPWGDSVVHLHSFSKTFSLPGYRVGTLTAGPEITDAVTRLLDCVTICAPTIGQHAALYSLDHLERWAAAKGAGIAARARRFSNELSEVDTGFSLVACGTFYGYLEHPFLDLAAKEVAHGLVDEQAVITLPGSAFGPGQERYLRVAFANLGTELIGELIRRISTFGEQDS